MKRNIAVLVQDLSVAYTLEVLEGIASYFKGKDANIILCHVGNPLSPDSAFAEHYWTTTKIIESKDISVVIIVSATFCSSIPPDKLAEMLRPLSVKKIISIGYRLNFPDCHSTHTTSESAYREVIAHLREKHGCSRIAYISAVRTGAQEAEERFSSFRNALSENGLPFIEELVFNGSFTFSSAHKEISEKIKSKEDLNFDALLAANDMMAFGAMSALTEAGISIPDDVKIFGYDNIFQARMSDITLSTIDQQISLQGKKAAELAYKALNGEKIPDITEIESAPVYRNSCGCRPKNYRRNTKLKAQISTDTYIRDNQRMTNIYHLLDLTQGTDTLDELYEKLEVMMFLAKISALAVCLYKEPVEITKNGSLILPTKARLAVALEYNKLREINSGKVFNPMEQILPDETFASDFGAYIMQPLFFGDKQYGYVLCSSDCESPMLYSLYLKIFSNSICQSYEYTKKLEENERLSLENEVLHKKNSTLKVQSKTDELTKILNRRGFLNMGQKAINFAIEMGTRGIVFFGDMDNLKKINDTYGHRMGDEAIIAQAEILTQSLRASDVVGRLSGDEFAAVITGTSFAEFSKIRKKVLSNCQKVSEEKKLPFEISISLGAVEFGEGNSNLELLLMKADKEQYMEKRRRHAERR